jgi:hypothetical protein
MTSPGLSRRALLGAAGASAAVSLLGGCSQAVDGQTSKVQKRVGAETGVESIDMTTDLPNETIYFKNWSGKVVFSEKATDEQVGALIGLFFKYAKEAGLGVDNMTSATFRTHRGGYLDVRRLMLDTSQAAQAGVAMSAMPQATLAVSSGSGRPCLDASSTVMRDSAKDLTRSAALMFTAPALDLFETTLTISDHGNPHPYTVYATHRLTVADLGFAATCHRWVMTHPTTGFVLPFSTQANAHIMAYTDTDLTAEVKALAAAARDAGVTSVVDAYLNTGSTPYLTIE